MEEKQNEVIVVMNQFIQYTSYLIDLLSISFFSQCVPILQQGWFINEQTFINMRFDSSPMMKLKLLESNFTNITSMLCEEKKL